MHSPPLPRSLASVALNRQPDKRVCDQRRNSGCKTGWLLAGTGFLPLLQSRVFMVYVLLCWGVFPVLTLYSPRSIVWGLFFFSSPSSCYAVFFLPLSTYISLLIIPCIIVYVTNNKEPWEPRGSKIALPTLPLLPPPPLSSGSPSAHPEPTICTVLICHHRALPVSIVGMAGESLAYASSLWVLDAPSAHRPSASTMAPSSLLSAAASQSTGFAQAPSFLWRPTALVCHHPSVALGLHSSTLSFRLCQAPPSPRLLLGPLLLRLHHGLPDPCLCLGHLSPLFRRGDPDPPHHPGTSAFHLGLLRNLFCCRRLAPPESSALPPTWLLPPSAPPWVVFMAAAWVLLGSTCSKSLLSPLFFITTLLVFILLPSLLPRSHPLLLLLRKDALFWGGGGGGGTFLVCFPSPCASWLSFSLVWLVIWFRFFPLMTLD